MTGLYEFPDRWLRPADGELRVSDAAEMGDDIRIPLQPFDLGEFVPADERPQRSGVTETALRFDLPRPHPSSSKQSLDGLYTFPVNPEPGYIDGSVYIMGAHVPADVGAIVLASSTATTTLRGRFLFEFEGLPFQDRDFEITAVLRLR